MYLLSYLTTEEFIFHVTGSVKMKVVTFDVDFKQKSTITCPPNYNMQFVCVYNASAKARKPNFGCAQVGM